jgi:transcriptional regulator with XRE-family HTH domain
VPDVESLAVGSRVKHARQTSGLTQQALASKAGVSIRTLSLIETGEDTKVSTLVAIATALDLSIVELLEADTDNQGVA